ncbi:SPOR domain-containing protein [Salipiger sp. 1_MG-2023]|uniref:SPOR domain-containing protein n=1 Tax=Salipiger sp. 1_MG-2023 TaxID=3062665 RepID=UPI0026E3A898|nr:SPOR domain-containing protein [Salipiger sp. 1_MG-2023]MDO6585862.1 SPOR domain-containing protein [Salipiger sp. 1_MG-2023]
MGKVISSRRARSRRLVFVIAGLTTLAACDDMKVPGFMQQKPSTVAAEETAARAGTTAERDIEAPEIFHATEAGLWDGRPSLGGVWVAHPDVKDPERVIIRNQTNGQFVIGALFRRERQSPGPRLQVSSDAAAALEMLAGAPTNLDVIALRRELVEVAPAPAEKTASVPEATEVTETTLDPVAGAASAAIDAAPAAAPSPTPEAAKPASKPASTLDKPFLQIGIFSIEQNADNTATAMRQQGMVPTVRKQESSGKTFWRVIVGPAQSASERDALLKKIKAAGFTDAYAVSN